MQEGVKLTEGLTQMFLLYSDLISHTQQTRKNQHTYKQWKIEFETYFTKVYIVFAFQNYSLVEVIHLLLRLKKTKFFL